MAIFGLLSTDIILDQWGAARAGTIAKLYASQALANAGGTPLTFVRTGPGGRFEYSNDALATVWARTLNGTVLEFRVPGAAADDAVESSTYGRRDYIATFIVAADGTGTHTTLTAAVAAITNPGTRILIKPTASTFLPTEPGSIVLPNLNDCSIESWAQSSIVIPFPAGSSGIGFAGTALTYRWRFANLTLQGPGITDSGNGIGLHLDQANNCVVENVKALSWSGAGIRETGGAGGALHNIITNPGLKTCAIGFDHIGGTGGANAGNVIGGEISFCTVGIKGDATSNMTLRGTSMESNTQAIDWAGGESTFEPGRFEGNTADVIFQAGSTRNVLDTPFFDAAKHVDLGVVNQVRNHRNIEASPGSVGGVLALDPRKGNVSVGLTENVTSMTVAAAGLDGLDGQLWTLMFTQLGSGFTLTWPATFHFAGGVPPASLGSFETTVLTMIYSVGGSRWYEVSRAVNIPY